MSQGSFRATGIVRDGYAEYMAVCGRCSRYESNFILPPMMETTDITGAAEAFVRLRRWRIQDADIQCPQCAEIQSGPSAMAG